MPTQTVQIKIPGIEFTDAADLPVIRLDSLLPAAGALFLVDPTHPTNPWAAGAPANSSTVPNLAWEQAAAAIGSGTATTLAADIYNVGLTSTAGKVERTTKGGLHGIISPTYAFTDGTVGLNVALPQAIYDYTRANPTHHYYLSQWHRVTRAAQDFAVASVFSACISTTSSPKYLAAFTQATNNIGTSDGASAITDTVGGPRFRNLAGVPTASYGTDGVNSTYTPGSRSAWLVGNRNFTNQGSTRRGKGGSRILYRTYLEDLTVSGRTYSQVNTLDAALFAAICSTAGGRYYGDTFTDPATIT